MTGKAVGKAAKSISQLPHYFTGQRRTDITEMWKSLKLSIWRQLGIGLGNSPFTGMDILGIK